MLALGFMQVKLIKIGGKNVLASMIIILNYIPTASSECQAIFNCIQIYHVTENDFVASACLAIGGP